MKWTDATSLRHGERGKISPCSWRCDIEGVKLWISTNHVDYRGEWVMRLNDGNPQRIASGEMSAENAQKVAMEQAWHQARQNLSKWQGVSDALFAYI